MPLTVNDRANAIGTFRFVQVRLMETVAAWTPTTPETDVKVMFGRHIWDFAQHADALGKRMFELRRPEQQSRRPTDEYVTLLDRLASYESTSDRLAAMYAGFLTRLEQRYRQFIASTDPILDEPSLVIIDRILRDFERQRGEAAAASQRLGVAASSAARTIESLDNEAQKMVTA